MQLIIPILTINDLGAAARKLLDEFPTRRIFAFYGEMGAGKTTLIKEICLRLGVEENEISSPTFALINEYHSASENLIYHFDFYRIKNETEVFDFGYEDYFYSGNYCFIEWPEKIPGLLPTGTLKIQIAVENGNRTLIVSDLLSEKR